MKKILLIGMVLLVAYAGNAQSAKNVTMIDLYFSEYSNQPGYKKYTLNEDMIKNSIAHDMWKHPSIKNIMQHVKLYQNLSFRSTSRLDKQIIDKISEQNRINNKYKEYFRFGLNGGISTIIYTKGENNNITELVCVTINKSNVINVSCFVGDGISMEDIESLVKNN